jgi:hypothetical protein
MCEIIGAWVFASVLFFLYEALEFGARIFCVGFLRNRVAYLAIPLSYVISIIGARRSTFDTARLVHVVLLFPSFTALSIIVYYRHVSPLCGTV